jgi:hypothetical protein
MQSENSHNKKTLKTIGMKSCIILHQRTIRYAPEQLHFGFANPAFTDLIEIWPKVTSPQEYADKIFQEIESIRTKAREKSSSWNKTNIIYCNQKRLELRTFNSSIQFERPYLS